MGPLPLNTDLDIDHAPVTDDRFEIRMFSAQHTVDGQSFLLHQIFGTQMSTALLHDNGVNGKSSFQGKIQFNNRFGGKDHACQGSFLTVYAAAINDLAADTEPLSIQDLTGVGIWHISGFGMIEMGIEQEQGRILLSLHNTRS